MLGLSTLSLGAVAPPMPHTMHSTESKLTEGFRQTSLEQGLFDVNAALAGGATSGASGDNAVAAAADEDSGAVGVVGEDTAIGAAAPGAAIGFGFNGLFGTSSATNPAATPSAANIFNIFNN